MTQIEKILDSGLIEKTKAEYIREKFEGFTSIAEEWSEKANKIVVTDDSQKDLMANARDGRLLLKAKRIEVEKLRKSLKEQSLQEGRLIDGVAKYLTSLIEPAEKHLELQEKFVEIREQEKRFALKQERIKILTPYSDVIDLDSLQLDLMTDEAFQAILLGAKIALETKIKAQAEKEDAEQKEKLFLQRTIKISEYKRFILPTDLQLTQETTDKEFSELLELLESRFIQEREVQEQKERELLELKKQNEQNEIEIQSLKTIVKNTSTNFDVELKTIKKISDEPILSTNQNDLEYDFEILLKKYDIAKTALDSTLWYIIPFPLRTIINEAIEKIKNLEKNKN
jgi:hypothetical protein